MIGICTDSNAQLPRELIDRYEIEVVPLTVTVDANDYLEGIDLDADRFYELFANGREPVTKTAAPSTGRFAASRPGTRRSAWRCLIGTCRRWSRCSAVT